MPNPQPKINVIFSIQVEGGPQVSVPPIEIPIEAYDKIQVSVKPGEAISVAIQPGDQGVGLLLIKSSLYTPVDAATGKTLTYEPDGKPATILSTPQLFLGAETIATLLGAVKTIKFSNNLAGDADKVTAVIEVLVGRDATP
jgi:hypothetical protein